MNEGLAWLARTLRARRAYRAHLALSRDVRLGAVRMRVHETLAREWLARVR